MGLFVSAIFLSILPFLFLFIQWKVLGDVTYAFANIAGLIGATLLIWQYLLGIRPLAERLFGKQIYRVRLHMTLGIYGMFFILVHPFLELIAYGEKLTFILVPAFSYLADWYMNAGRIAFFFLLFIWVTSAILRNRLPYKLWQRFHYLTYTLLFFVFIHAVQLGTFLRTFPLIRAYFFLLGGIYVAVLVWRLVFIYLQRRKPSPP